MYKKIISGVLFSFFFIDCTAMERKIKRPKLRGEFSGDASIQGQAGSLESHLKKIKVKKIEEPDPVDVLYKAFNDGDEKKIRSLFNAGVSINMQNHSGETLLHIAARKKNARLMHKFIECGINFAIKNNKGIDAFLLWHDSRQLCYLWEDLEWCNYIGNRIPYYTLAHYILHGGDLEEQDRNENSLIHYVTFNGQTAGIRMLLQYGAYARALGAERTTPLHQAAVKGHTKSIITLLTCPQGGPRSECENFIKSKQQALATLCYFKKMWDWENAQQGEKDRLPFLPNEMRYLICSFILPRNLIDHVPLPRLHRYFIFFFREKNKLFNELVDRHVNQVAEILNTEDEGGKTPVNRAHDEGYSQEITNLLHHNRASLKEEFGKQITQKYKNVLRLK